MQTGTRTDRARPDQNGGPTAGLRLELTAAQREVWLAERLRGPSRIYNTADWFDVRGPFDRELFESALRRVIGETEAFRTRFVDGRDGTATQVVDDHVDVAVRWVDLVDTPDADAVALSLFEEDLATLVDLANGPLFGTILVRTGPQRHLWYQSIHHLTLDGYGGGLFVSRVAETYTALLEGTEPAAGEPAGLADLVADDVEYHLSDAHAEDREFWRTELAGAERPARLGRPVSRPSAEFRRRTLHLDDGRSARLRELATRSRQSLPALLVAAAGWFAGAVTGEAEAAVGLFVTGRRSRTARSVPGMVANIVPVRVPTGPWGTVGSVTATVSRRMRTALRHQRYGYEDMRRQVRHENGLATLVSVHLNYIAFEGDHVFGPARARVHNLSNGPVEDVSLVVYDRGGHEPLQIDVNVNPEAHDAADLDRMTARLESLLTGLAEAGVDSGLTAVAVTTDGERREALDLGDGGGGRGADACLDSLFTRRVREQGERTAIAVAPGGATPAADISYAGLHARVDDLAAELRAHGVRPGDRVVLLLERGIDLVASMLAVLRLGAVFVPVDVRTPAARVQTVVDVSAPAAVMSTVDGAPALRDPAPSPVTVDGPQRARGPVPGDRRAHPRAAAGYVSFTSGSTGMPKGVLVRESALVGFLRGLDPAWAPADGERVAAVTTSGFDIALLEMLGPIVAGGTVVVVPPEIVADPWRLSATLRESEVDVVQATPAVWEQTVAADRTLLRRVRVLVGGDALGPAAATLSDAPHGAWNLYGPTEATIWATAAAVRGDGVPPIGRPLPGTAVHVLDRALRPLSGGMVGEVHLSGVQLAECYLGRPAETATRFVACPTRPGERMYRTGDLGWWGPDGQLMFVGRADAQVKIRGFRVEPGEVEATLSAVSGVDACVVVARDDALVAYVVAGAGTGVDQLRDACRTTLPAHLVPASFVLLDELPLTANRKVDRAALPPPGGGAVASGDDDRSLTATERLALDAVRDVLQRPDTGPDDDFFVVGGHSLAAVRLVARLRSSCGTELTVQDVFDHPRAAELARLVDERRADGVGDVPAGPVPGSAGPDAPLSPGQRRAWLVHHLAERDADGPVRSVLNVRSRLRLDGGIDPRTLRRALVDVITRHEVLRTLYPEARAGGPDRRVLDPADAAGRLDWTTGPGGPDDTPDPGGVASRPFDLHGDLPVRGRLTAGEAGGAVLDLVAHHVAMDGWSWDVVLADLGTAYRERAAGRAPVWPRTDLTYPDVAAWQHQRALAGAAAHALDFWRDELAGAPERVDLPGARARPVHRDHRAGAVTCDVDSDAAAAVRSVARAGNASVFMVVHALLGGFLARSGAGTDLPVGTAVAGRDRDEWESIVGFFVNTVVLRTDVSGDPSLTELVARVRETDLAAFAHRDVPFEDVVDALVTERSTSHHPLAQVMLVQHDAGERAPDFGASVETRVEAVDDLNVQGDVVVEFVDDAPGGMRLRWTYATDLLAPETAEGIARRFGEFADRWVADPGAALSGLDVLAGVESLRVSDWSEGHRETPHWTDVVSGWDERVRAGSGGVAVVSESGARWTVADVEAQANRWCRWLWERGVGRGDVVGVVVPRSVDAIVLMLAVVKAGGAYALIDSDYPAGRVASMTEVASPALLVDEAVLGAARPELACLSADPVGCSASPSDPAYVVFTSGSTGVPKGVVVSHAAMADYLSWAVTSYPGLSGPSLLHSAMTFDLTLTVLWGPLLAGGCVVVSELDAELVAPAGGFTFLKATTSHLAIIELCSGLLAPEGADLVLGGEQVHGRNLDGVRELYPRTRVWNEYGPTEVTVGATSLRIGPNDTVDRGAVPIGRPAPNHDVRVLDGRLRPVPPGVVGHVYLSGVGVARGYLGASAATAVRFVPDPVSGLRAYCTGDLAWWDADGRLVFVGRDDAQVKVRGFRVEPGEVELALSDVPGLGRVVVALRDERLVAYLQPDRANGGARDTAGPARREILTNGAFGPQPVVGRHGTPRSADPAGAALVERARGRAAERLPEYMVPAAWVVVDELPLTTNRKVDRDALPAPRFDAGGDRPASETSTGDDPTVDEMVVLIGEMLRIDRLAPDDDLFVLGGNSLFVARLVGRIRERWGVRLALREVLDDPTAAGLAALVTDRAAAPASTARSSVPDVPVPGQAGNGDAPLAPAQQRLWLVNRMDEVESGGVRRSLYNAAWMLDLHGELDVAALRTAWFAVLGRHEVLRTTYPEVAGEPVQRVLPLAEAVAAADWAVVDDEAAIEEALRRPFDVRAAVPVRVRCVRRGEGWRFVVVAHHIAVDGWSWPVLARDLGAAYRTAREGGVPQVEPAPLRYRDVAHWRHARLGSGGLDASRDHWRARLAGLPQALQLPEARPRPPRRDHRVTSRRFAVGPAAARRVRALATAAGASSFMVAHGLLAGFLARSGSGADLPVGTAVTGRAEAALDDVVGFLVDTVVLRTRVDGDPTLTALLDRSRDVVLDAYAHQELPFDQVVDAVGPVRDSRHHPLVQVMLVQHEDGLPGLDLGAGTTSEPVAVPARAEQFDLMIEFREVPDDRGGPGIDGLLTVASDLYGDAALSRLVGAWEAWIETWTAEPDLPVGVVELTPEIGVRAEPEEPPSGATGPAVRPSGSRIESQALDVVREVVGKPDLAIDEDLVAAGTNSLLAARVSVRLRDELGLRVPIRSMFEHATLAAVLEAVAVDGAASAATDALATVLPLRLADRAAARRTLFCLPPAGGVGWPYRALLPHLDTGVDVIALQAPRYRRPDSVSGTVDGLAVEYADLIRESRPDGRYDLLGWSFGGLVAHAVACRLSDRPPSRLIVLDGYPQFGSAEQAPSGAQARARLLGHVGADVDVVGAACVSTAETARVLAAADGPLSAMREPDVAVFTELFADTGAVARAHVPDRYPGPLDVVVAAGRQEHVGAWVPFAGEVAAHPVAAGHDELLDPGPVGDLGPLVARLLAP